VGIDVKGFTTGLRVEKCRLDGPETGIRVQAGSDATLWRNLVLGGEVGIAVEGDGCTLFGNKVRGATGWGIQVTGDGNAVDKNRLELSGPLGVPAEEAGSSNTFTRNEVLRSLAAGIELGGFGNAAVQNLVKLSTGHGILVTGSGGHSAGKNKIRRAGDDGIKLRDPDPDEVTFDARNNSLTDNHIAKPAADGIDCENPENTIEGNRIKGAGDNGLEFGQEGSDNVVSDNRAKGSGLYDLFDDAGGNDYSDNVFKTVDPEGAQP
jgi:hypothetical protein